MASVDHIGSEPEVKTNGSGNGAATATGELPVENPATGEIVATLQTLDAAQVAQVAAAARAAQPGWAATSFDQRGQVMRRAQKWVIDNVERVTSTIMSETGKAYEDAQLEVSYAAHAFGFWASHAEKYLREERVRSSQVLVKGKKLKLRYQPLGLIGVIGPWNYPLVNSFGDCIPALMAGNAVILKPSEITPLTSLMMAEALSECGLPENVFQVAIGRGDTGSALIDVVDMVMFTGSTRTGKKVMERAAANLTPVSLELGGKDSMIVLADADLERAANCAVYYGMQNAGQTCISVERVYVEAPAYEEFVGKVTDKVGKLRMGAPEGPGSVEVGAITFPPQLEIINRHVQDALAKGATAVTGGKIGSGPGGRFFEPTVLTGVDHTMECMTEETFGPTLPIMEVENADAAIRLANESPYGLGGSVFTRDLQKGEAVAKQMQAGGVCVNDAIINYLALELPFGGWKASGLGSRHGPTGIRKYCAQQSLLVTGRMSLKRELHMFPYSAKMTGRLFKLIKLMYGRGNRD